MKLMIVGGFLGAGKTTLLWESARRLAAEGNTVGLITNDQVPDLVDTAVLSRSGAVVREVAGSCFCCDFNGFKEAVDSLVDSGADIIIAEPVGSCTDLSATVLQPLKALMPEHTILPFSVLVDPARIDDTLRETRPVLHADAVYILHLQLEEADRIVLNKADILSPGEVADVRRFLNEEFPGTPVTIISALTGEGVSEWLVQALAGGAAGTRIIPVDYDRYAHGEAVLGWLNAVVELQRTGDHACGWESYATQFLEAFRRRLAEISSEIGHLKLLIDGPSGRVAANLTQLKDKGSCRVEGVIESIGAVLTVNARVQADPSAVEGIIREVIAEISGEEIVAAFRMVHCIQPGRPQPTYRYDTVVDKDK